MAVTGVGDINTTLENLSPISKSAGDDGQVVIEISYEVAA